MATKTVPVSRVPVELGRRYDDLVKRLKSHRPNLPPRTFDRSALILLAMHDFIEKYERDPEAALARLGLGERLNDEHSS